MITNKRRRNEDADEKYDMDKIEKYVTLDNNTIYFYADVCRESILLLNMKIKEATEYIQKLSINTGCTGRIFLHICSDGGSLHDGLAAMDTIKSNKVPITTIMEGAVCSAATLIALGGDTICIRPSAFVLIHQVSSSFWGKYEEFNDEKKTLDKLMNFLRKVYKENTNIPMKELDNMLKRDIYINSHDCIKWNIAHKIV